ncbi:MAG TPA: hypothetical protein VHL53_04815 [Acidimicrobiia bacterium]|nr:hypothetical protein [Acidimicrobiia bacterium]
MTDRQASTTLVRPGEVRVERRSGADRRRDRDRRSLDLIQQLGRPGLDLRCGVERRSGKDRRRAGPEPEPQVATPPVREIVTPWQITGFPDG